MDGNFNDPEGRTVTISGSFSPTATFITYNNMTRTFTSTPAESDVGNYTFTLAGDDGHSDSANATLTVSNSMFYICR